MGQCCVSVELQEHGVVRGRGEQTLTWWVKDGDLWRRAAEIPGAVLTSEEPGPGTIWQRRIVLPLNVGTTLERVVAEPKPDPSRDVLMHLERGQKAGRAVQRTRYRVNARGDLARVDDD